MGGSLGDLGFQDQEAEPGQPSVQLVQLSYSTQPAHNTNNKTRIILCYSRLPAVTGLHCMLYGAVRQCNLCLCCITLIAVVLLAVRR